MVAMSLCLHTQIQERYCLWYQREHRKDGERLYLGLKTIKKCLNIIQQIVTMSRSLQSHENSVFILKMSSKLTLLLLFSLSKTVNIKVSVSLILFCIALSKILFRIEILSPLENLNIIPPGFLIRDKTLLYLFGRGDLGETFFQQSKLMECH